MITKLLVYFSMLKEKRMSNLALIIAGGVGARMNQDIPKQFLNVNDKPVIVYTMEVFQKIEYRRNISCMP